MKKELAVFLLINVGLSLFLRGGQLVWPAAFYTMIMAL